MCDYGWDGSNVGHELEELRKKQDEAFEARMKKKQEIEDEKEKLEAERLQAAYLRRTGRTEYKP